MKCYKSPRFSYLPSFTGGIVGYFSYEYLGYSEPAVRCEVEDAEKFKDVDVMLFDKVIAFDHVKQKLILIVNHLGLWMRNQEEGSDFPFRTQVVSWPGISVTMYPFFPKLMATTLPSFV